MRGVMRYMHGRGTLATGVLVLATLVSSPCWAPSWWVLADRDAYPTGDCNYGDLTYYITGYHTTQITAYKSEESFLKVLDHGKQTKGGQFYTACADSGSITWEGGTFFCSTPVVVDCPSAEATWYAKTRGGVRDPESGFTAWKNDSTGPYYAQCCDIDPPGCGPSYQATKVFALDVETGRVIQPDWYFEAPQGLTRNEVVDGNSYFQEEWVLVGAHGDGWTPLLSASSPQAQAQIDTYMSALEDASGFRADSRYLVIEAARHIYNRVEPLVRLESLSTGKPVTGVLPDGRVTFRASFSSHGDLGDVQAIEGDQQAAWLLAEDLQVVFPFVEVEASGHEDHRSVVFAVFEIRDGRRHFISAVPTLPQCCCGEEWCA